MVNLKGAPGSMRTHRYLALTALLAIVVGACSSSASPAPSTASAAPAATATPAASTGASTEPSASASAAAASPSPLAPDPAEAVIPNVEQNAQITFWTFYLSPTFDQYIKDTIARFQATYPTVTVKWEDHQATFKDDLNNAFAANIAPDVINLSVSEGWVSEYAAKGLLLPLDTAVPKTVQDIYFPGLWKEQLINGVNYQFPWYQGLNVELINHAIYDKTGLTVDQFPKKVQDLPALCKTILDKTSTVCDIRLTVSDLLAQMVYEGGVKVYNADNTAFAFNSPEGVAWLQMYVDMVKAGTVDNTVLTTNDDRVGLNAFSAGAAAFYATGPNLARAVKDTNATLYGNLAMVPAPLGLSNVTGQGPDVDLGQEGHQVPERLHGARPVLHQPAQHGRVLQAGRDLSVVRRRRTRIRSSRLRPPRSRTAPGRSPAASSPPTRTSSPPSSRRPTSTTSSSRPSSRRCSTTSLPSRRWTRPWQTPTRSSSSTQREPWPPGVRIPALARSSSRAGQPISADRAGIRGSPARHH